MIDVAELAKTIVDEIVDDAGIITVNQANAVEATIARVLAAALPIGDRLTDGDKQERARLRQLERVVLNQLGTTDPREVAAFCVRARLGRTVSDEDMAALIGAPSHVARVLDKMRLGDKPDEGLDFGHVARCAPQADGASEWPAGVLDVRSNAAAIGPHDEQDVIALQRAYTAAVDGC